MNRSEFERLLSELLSYAVKKPELAAHALVTKYKDMTTLASADGDELAATEHVGVAGAHLLRLTFALRSRRITDKYPMGRQYTEAEFREYLTALFFDSPNETVCAFFIDDRGRVAFSELLGEGTVNSMTVLPRKVLELSVKRGCRRIILAHNHPGGEAIASDEDIVATDHIAHLLSAAQRELVAHYIVAGNEVSKIIPKV